ncbi:phospholipid scramblase 1-like [Elgaria multicarinata webbii]|uniref:phospholipid scramblase 1-like n=1 Tax=Elgaria multicarinata webbii TaxID=159646 RepID=UPI002FCD4541
MPPPHSLPSCPPGLEYLSQIDRLLIHQQLEILEIITNIETYNKYEIKNSLGETVYFAFEENDCCTLTCCGASRPFVIKIVDNSGQEIIEFLRPYRCSSCFCPCCLQELFVYAPPGFPIGYVKQIWDPCLPRFAIQNTAERDMLRIVGPCSVCSCGGDVNFEVMSVDELHTIGRVSKYWSGFVREVFTDADDIGIHFPLDLDVNMKAVMIGACFLIDYMFFEHTGLTDCCRCGCW